MQGSRVKSKILSMNLMIILNRVVLRNISWEFFDHYNKSHVGNKKERTPKFIGHINDVFVFLVHKPEGPIEVVGCVTSI